MTFKIADCTFDEGVPVHFVNELGFIDTFLFKYRSGDTYQKDADRFVAPLNTDTTFKVHDRGNYDINVSEGQLITLRSDWLTQSQQNYLQQLVTSSGVWIDLGAHSDCANDWHFLSVTVDDSEFKAVNYDAEFVSSLEITLRVANLVHKNAIL